MVIRHAETLLKNLSQLEEMIKRIEQEKLKIKKIN